MESRWLEDFLSLVDTRNFSRSAQTRYTTQPAFSRRIKSLEEWVGAQLFNRATQPITLTLSGERFRPVAEDVLRRLYQGREEARRINEIGAHTIRFAATHSLSLNFFPYVGCAQSKCTVTPSIPDSIQASSTTAFTCCSAETATF